MLREIGESVGGWWQFALHAHACNPLFCLAGSRACSRAWVLYIKWPHLPGIIDSKLKPLRVLLENKYYFDWFNENVIAPAQPPAGHGFLEGRRRAPSSTPSSVNGSANIDRLDRRHRAPRAERLPLFLRVLDGHRTRRHARLVPDARLI